MNAIYQLRFKVVGLLIAVLLTGCAVLEEGWTDRAARGFLAPQDELATVIELYDYAEQMRGLPSTVRVQEYRNLEHNLTEDAAVRDRLKLALFFSGIIEPELVDYDRARKLLEDSLAEDQGALLKGHIQFMSIILDQNIRQQERLQALQKQLIAQQRENQALQQQLTAQQRENQALQAKTRTLEEQIQTLEAKIEALTSIEQSLKKRGQVE